MTAPAVVTRRRVRKPPVIYPSCGSNSGYNGHMRRGESACVDCKEAHRVEIAKWRGDNLPPTKPTKKQDPTEADLNRRRRQKARRDAIAALIRQNRAEFDRLYGRALRGVPLTTLDR